MKDQKLIEMFIWSVALMTLILAAGVCQVTDGAEYYVLCGPQDCTDQ